MRAPFGVRVTSNELTGVAKSTTSKRRASVGRSAGAREVDDDAAAFLLEARLHARIAGADDDAAGAVGAAAEIDLVDRAQRRRGAGAAGAAVAGRSRPQPRSCRAAPPSVT